MAGLGTARMVFKRKQQREFSNKLFVLVLMHKKTNKQILGCSQYRTKIKSNQEPLGDVLLTQEI